MAEPMDHRDDTTAAPGEVSRSLGAPAVVLEVVVQTVFHLVLVFALYLHFAGHNQPGGGFIAGLAVGAALVLRMITGNDPIRTRFPVPYSAVLGIGALLVTGTALVPMLLGNSPLEHHTWEADLPVLGDIKATSALVFDTGILLVVVGVIGTLLQILGSEDVAAAGDAPAENPGGAP
jgi:multisubunit Na+/H+ antiporter MnhB subunit